MNRRSFLYTSAFGGLALTAFPSMLASCKDGLAEDLRFEGKVIVIGAGAAGLYAAQILLNQGADVIVLEASNRIGGRIKNNSTFSDFPIELGAEEVHGEKSMLYDAAVASGAQFVDEESTDYYYFNGSLKSEAEATENTLFNTMLEAVDGIVDYTGGDTTAQAYGEISNVSDNVAHIFNALVGNEHGTDNSRIGMFGLRTEEERWTSGDQNLPLRNTTMDEVIRFACADALPIVALEQIVQTIEHHSNGVRVTTADGTVYSADAIVCTVPITQLKNNSIQFIPSLSAAKLAAIQKIGMDRGMKIILQFSERIWPSNMSAVYGRGLIPIFWATSLGRSDEFILTGFVHGSNAEALAAMGEQGILNQALEELDVLFGEASDTYVQGLVYDWGNEPFIEGAYSYPTPDMGDAIEVLAQPVGNRLFFAGEASHTGGHTSTVHGAMETGLRAALEVIQNTPRQ